ncbi:hypothetical protein NM208_g1950 [Fusarium decemcellulare]|uniref:Uncharacterized protein n=2 Tax=Fusarium decemcellulare TaxID=57161 RepID=A0ACC1SM72_9HYPO|nr:hypothetical protein NM208_g3983 [Fusarium decemcellulare]KAJ3546535.1 hypothetical protein NM208_g1950 [Fusarium decemcellulare]
MPSADQAARGVTAENRAGGIQPLHQGDGNLAVQAGESGIQNNVAHQNYFHNCSEPQNYIGCQDGGLLTLTAVIEQHHDRIGNTLVQPTKSEIIDWLKRIFPGADQVTLHRGFLADIVPGTGTWVLGSTEFESWKDGRLNFLWMHGDLGSGKTTLACLIIDTIEQQERIRNAACVYLYFRGTQVCFEQIVIRILKQLLQQQQNDELYKDLVDKYNEWRRHRKLPSAQQYLDLINTVCEAFSQVYLVLDALDDCINYDGEKTQELVQDMIQTLRSRVKILVTSRSSVLNEEHLKPDVSLKVVPDTQDIKLYVKNRIINDHFMRDELRQSAHPNIQDEIVEKVVDATKGIFLMARLDMDYLCEQGSLGLIKSALHQLPRSVPSAFKTSINQIKRTDEAESMVSLRGLAPHVLTWIVNALTPLNAEQISLSFALRYCDKTFDRAYMLKPYRVMSACAGLVTMDPETGVLRLVHESVGQHLVEHKVIPQKAHMIMAKACLKCLLLDDSPGPLVDVASKHFERPLIEYCASHWATHLRQGQLEEVDLDVEDLALTFLNNNAKVERAFHALPGQQNEEFQGMTGLHAAVYYGESRWAQSILNSATNTRVNINTACSDGQTALHWAAKYGRESMVELLIQGGANLNVRDKNGDSPLHVALWCSTTHCEGVVARLVRAGARSDIRGRKGRTPLAWTIRYGPPSIAEMLAQSPEVVNAEDDLGWTSLREAISQAQPDIVYLLLKNGADPNRASSKDDWTPLKAAVQNGDETITKHLIRSGARVNEPDQELGFSPLRWAIMYNHTEIVHLLINHGADLNAKAKDGTTPLLAAVKERKKRDKNKSIAWMLLEYGARPDERDRNGGTALHHAILNSDRSMAWLLISNKASVDIEDQKGLAPLDWAVERDDLSSCLLLCEHGARADAPGHNGLTACHRAAARGRVKMVQYFLTLGIDVDQPDELGNTAIHHAMLKDRAEVIALLASGGAALDRQNHEGSTVLHMATKKHNCTMVKLLLDHGASCHIRDNSGRTALHRAATAGFSDGLALLIQGSKALDLTDDDGATTLHLVAFRGDENSVRSLVNSGASRTVKDCYGNTPLQVARQWGHTHLTAYLE